MDTSLQYLAEPELEFGRDRHPDIRYGILNFGPYDLQSSLRPSKITIGFVGTPQSVAVAERWIESCREEIPAKISPKINLFAPFPGFSHETPWLCDVVLDSSFNTLVGSKDIELLARPGTGHNDRVRAAVDLFLGALTNSAQKRPDVLVLALPIELLELTGDNDGEELEEDRVQLAPVLSPKARRKASRGLFNFHDMLKAKAIPLGIPLQLLRPSTCDPKLRRSEKDTHAKGRRRQDDATCAWNFFVALYYKGRGYPWRLPRRQSDLTTCFIGISFYETLDQSRLESSLAQVFDERGHGMIVRGGRVTRSEDDRAPHLDKDGAYNLLKLAMNRYRTEYRTNPARVVVHKSSSFSAVEIDGAKQAFAEYQISEVDLMSLDRSRLRLSRSGYYPALRGTAWSMDERRTLLYTNGSVQMYEEYPGLFVPRSLLIRHDDCAGDRLQLAAEILALTKMNWNNSQITALEPITLRAARQVARILKYVDDPKQEAIYSFFM